MKFEKTVKDLSTGYSYNRGINYLIVNNDGGAMFHGNVDVDYPDTGNRYGRQSVEVSCPSFRSEDPEHVIAHALALLDAAQEMREYNQKALTKNKV